MPKKPKTTNCHMIFIGQKNPDGTPTNNGFYLPVPKDPKHRTNYDYESIPEVKQYLDNLNKKPQQ